ncbi:hypothetical protein Taro_021073, partial [Colocasia esculenta]|nr:hypothetical protein [Colocasia esculenta]
SDVKVPGRLPHRQLVQTSPAEYHLKQHHSETVHIDLGCDGQAVDPLLHKVPDGPPEHRAVVPPHQLCDAHVFHLQVEVLVGEDVLRLDVAVGHLLGPLENDGEPPSLVQGHDNTAEEVVVLAAIEHVVVDQLPLAALGAKATEMDQVDVNWTTDHSTASSINIVSLVLRQHLHSSLRDMQSRSTVPTTAIMEIISALLLLVLAIGNSKVGRWRYIEGTNTSCKGSVDTTINGVDTMAQSKGRNVKKRSTSVDTSPGQVDTKDRSQRNMLTGFNLRSTPKARRSTLESLPRRPVLLSGTAGRHWIISGPH